ncbi:MAG: hypothetical protein K5921_06655 [Lachnospiraceae bacterium]|nr:hypothetical protein [Lachnospiraceae bacterium]
MSEINYDKPSKAPLIIAISVVVVLLLAAGGVLFWMNRPINKVNKAIENNDLKAVNENFEKLSDDDKEDIEEQMLDYAKDLAKDFTNGKKDYDDIEKDLRTLGKGVLKNNDDFEELTKQVEELKQSKDDYEAAEKAFKDEDYQKAMDLYAKVITDDPNYKTARDKIAECESKMTPDIVGEWACSIDIGDAMLKQIGLNSSEKDFTFPIIFLYIFNEDGTGRMTLDKAGFEDKIKEFIDIAIEEIIKQYKLNFGMSEEDIDKQFKSFYGMSFRDYIASELEKEDISASLEEADMDFTYEIVDDKVNITTSEGKSDTLDMIDDTLQLKDMDYDSYASFAEFGIELPLVFNKR